MSNKNIDINQICQDLYNGDNYPGIWHGFDWWGKASDFHEHPFFIWETIQSVFPNKPLTICETGRCTGQSTNLFSAIAQKTNGKFISFDISDWNKTHIENINVRYGIDRSHYRYITDSSLNAPLYLDSNTKIDVLFLDSLHSYEQVKQETLTFEKYLSDSYIIFFHDTVWCFDTVMGWIKDYLQDKFVIYAKNRNTHAKQCEYCEKFNAPNLMHGRPIMMPEGRPNFQSPYDKIELSPYYNSINYNFIKWSDISFEDAIRESNSLIFTNIEANCGIGTLVKTG